MSKRMYGQACGLARALELVGERWSLLIVRDLLVGPRRYTDLRHGLPRIPTNVLSTRLKELEAGGVIARRALPAPERSVVYELTGYGRELEDAVIALGRWGARSLPLPGPDDVITSEILTMALRTTFRPEAAGDDDWSLTLRAGDAAASARIHGRKLDAEPGDSSDVELIIEAGPRLKELLTGELTPEQAIAEEVVRLTGDPARLTRFTELFRIDEIP